MKKNIERILIFIAVFGSSISGGEIFGISVAKLAILPLLLLFLTKRGRSKGLKTYSILLLIWFSLFLISSAFGFFSPIQKMSGFDSRLLMNMVTMGGIYIPVVFLLSRQDNKTELFHQFKFSLLWTARIHAIWAILQFLLYSLFRFDLNSFALSWLFESGTSAFDNNYGSGEPFKVFIRATGINHDPAFLGIVIVCGALFDVNLIWKLLYVGTSALAMSRSSVIVIVFVVLLQMMHFLARKKMTMKKYAPPLLLASGLGVIVLFSAFSNPSIREPISHMFSRFEQLTVSVHQQGGDARHLMYLFEPFNVSMNNLSFVQILFGIGPRNGGNALSQFYTGSVSVVTTDAGSAWSIESDPGELWLGCGLLGFVAYYASLVSFWRKGGFEAKLISLSFVIFGLMYDIAFQPLTQLVLIFCTIYERPQRPCFNPLLIKVISTQICALSQTCREGEKQ